MWYKLSKISKLSQVNTLFKQNVHVRGNDKFEKANERKKWKDINIIAFLCNSL